MASKIGPISDAFEANNFEQVIALYEQRLKKAAKNQSEQKKNELTPQQLTQIDSCYCASLAIVGRIHDSAKIFRNKIKPQLKRIAKDSPHFFLSLLDMCLLPEAKQLVREMEKERHPNDPDRLTGHLLTYGQFSTLSKLLLGKSAKSQLPLDSLSHVYAVYLDIISTKQLMTQFSRDPSYKPFPKEVSLGIIKMFFNKLADNIKTIKHQERSKLTPPSFWRAFYSLQLRLAAHQGDIPRIINFDPKTIRGLFDSPFVLLRTVLQQSPNNQSSWKFYISQMGHYMQRNAIPQNHQPSHDYYQEFLQELLKRCPQLCPQIIISTQLFDFSTNTNPAHVLGNFIWSLEQQVKLILSASTKFIVKSSLLLLMKAKCHYGKAITDQIRLYAVKFGATFSCHLQLYAYCRNGLEIPYCPQLQTEEGFIRDINATKHRLLQQTSSNFEDLLQNWKLLLSRYQLCLGTVQKAKKIQIGQRYTADQYLTILFDTAWLLQPQLTYQQRQTVITALIVLLRAALNRSPSNADLHTRLLRLYLQQGYTERIFDCYKKLDVKSIQYETLGHWGLQCAMFDRMTSPISLVPYVRAHYHEARQVSQGGIKAITRGSPDLIEEHYHFRRTLDNSYSLCALLFAQYRQCRRDTESAYYLEVIGHLLKGQLFMNSDWQVSSSSIDPNYTDLNFYGIFNSPAILDYEIKLSRSFHVMWNGQNIALDLPVPPQIMFNQLYQFDRFHFPHKSPPKTHYANLILKKQLAAYQACSQLLTTGLQFCQSLLIKGDFMPDLLHNGTFRLLELFNSMTTKEQIHCIGWIRQCIADCGFLLHKVSERTKIQAKLKTEIDILVGALMQIQIRIDKEQTTIMMPGVDRYTEQIKANRQMENQLLRMLKLDNQEARRMIVRIN